MHLTHLALREITHDFSSQNSCLNVMQTVIK